MYMYIKYMCFKIQEKGHILRPFSGIAPIKMKMLSNNVRIEYDYIIIIYTNIYPISPPIYMYKHIIPLNFYDNFFWGAMPEKGLKIGLSFKI